MRKWWHVVLAALVAFALIAMTAATLLGAVIGLTAL
jgi:hypothetical protein